MIENTDVLPGTIPIDHHSVNVEQEAQAWLAKFNATLDLPDWDTQLPSLFSATPKPWWKDQLSLTWDLRTLHTVPQILNMFAYAKSTNHPRDFQLVPSSARFMEVGPANFIQAAFTFQTNVAFSSGLLRLIYDGEGHWKAWSLFTRMESLHRFAEDPARFGHRDDGVENAPDVIVIGAGQCGLQLAAALRAVGLKPLVIERERRIGDHWRKHYSSLKWHLPARMGCTFAYQDYPEEMDDYPTRMDVADFLESYANTLNISVITSCRVQHATFDTVRKVWTASLVTEDGGTRVLETPQIVLATGINGLNPVAPTIEGKDQFQGIAIHSSAFTDAAPWRGKKAIVVGAANTAHDIARDLVEGGAASTLIVQRSPTMILSRDSAIKYLTSIYGPSAPPLHVADRMQESYPYAVTKSLYSLMVTKLAEFDKSIVEGLEAVGYRTTSPLITEGYLKRYGGVLVDTGASSLIVSGKIKVKTGIPISRFTQEGLLFDDGENVPADLVVFATGYDIGSMRKTAIEIIGKESGIALKESWGLDDEGQLNAVWKDSGHENFWYTGGNLPHARYYSKILALQIQATHLGLRCTPYQAASINGPHS